jgi:DNA integrity scanning protein DisA with diadenylate cyclase activity
MKALFISIQDIKRHSLIDGNLDATKITPYIEKAQDIHVQSYLGTDLYEKFQSIIIAQTMDEVENADYKLLINNYIKPMLVEWSLVMYLPFASITIANGGVFKHSSENSETLSKDEVDYIQEQTRINANFYTDRLVKYLCDNSTKFPEYKTNSGSDISPTGYVDYLTWLT